MIGVPFPKKTHEALKTIAYYVVRGVQKVYNGLALASGITVLGEKWGALCKRLGTNKFCARVSVTANLTRGGEPRHATSELR